MDVIHNNLQKTVTGITKAFISPGTNVWDLPHTLIYGSNLFNSRIIIDHILKVHVYKNTNVIMNSNVATFTSRDPDNDVQLQYISFPKHIVFQLTFNMNVNELDVFVELLQSLTDSKSLTGLPKKVIVLHGLETIYNKHDHALRKILEDVQSSAWIIMDVAQLSRVMDPIKSRCVCVPARIDLRPITNELAMYYKRQVEHVDAFLNQHHCHDVKDVLMKLEADALDHISQVYDWTRVNLAKLHSHYIESLTQYKSISKYLAALKEMTQQLVNSGICIVSWIHVLLDLLKEQSRIHDIITVASHMQHYFKKDVLLIESLLHEIMPLL